ncbi:hypothetical protein AB1Y20_003773 [Prymnesium parvum]|uniref:PS II complex 12 kDa extrinsic protein n=1 Tax=Prymnesium parvum TaxID=97485 RepID=A0AB34J7H6_PRYPA
MMAPLLAALLSSTLVLHPLVAVRRSHRGQPHSLCMCDEARKGELAKEVKFAAYEPSKMAFKGADYKNAPLGGEAGKTLSGPAKYFPYAAAFAALGLATGGLTEQFVEEAFAPVRAAGGYSALLKMPDAPGLDKARELKKVQKEKRAEFLQNFQSEKATP